jgi:aspartyl-tRNA(Asn)/glutamyl-tRNA(Gln) amidotransferase subunit B
MPANADTYRVLHELGGLLTKTESEFSAARVPATSLATILHALLKGDVSGKNAKRLLSIVFEGEDKDVETIIEREDLRIQHLSDEEYHDMAMATIKEFPNMAQKVRNGQQGKLQWLVGQMIKRSGGRVDAQRAAGALAPLVQPPKA